MAIEETLERIATALEKIAAGINETTITHPGGAAEGIAAADKMEAELRETDKAIKTLTTAAAVAKNKKVAAEAAGVVEVRAAADAEAVEVIETAKTKPAAKPAAKPEPAKPKATLSSVKTGSDIKWGDVNKALFTSLTEVKAAKGLEAAKSISLSLAAKYSGGAIPSATNTDPATYPEFLAELEAKTAAALK